MEIIGVGRGLLAGPSFAHRSPFLNFMGVLLKKLLEFFVKVCQDFNFAGMYR